MFKTENNKKILLNNIAITVLICTLFSSITIFFTTRNKNPVNTQTQSININSDQFPKVNINTATREELKQLPSVGDKLADRIISKRPYKNIYEIVNIEGIGDKNFKNIERRICVD